jgi:alpha-tubulin suppressor-like RCC1 family protein
VVAVAVNRDAFTPTAFAVKADGTLWGWGNGQYGKLGNGNTSNQSSPTQVSTGGGMGLTDAVAVAAGAVHTLALHSDGTVWAWGGRFEGALGDGSTTSHVTTPQQVSGLSGIIAIDAGYRSSIALKSDGTVYTWGRGEEGQIGDGATTDKTTPTR